MVCKQFVRVKNLTKVTCRWRNDSVDEDFIKSYNKDSDIGYFLEFDVQCQKKLQYQLKCQCKKLHELNNYLPFLPERIKIRKVPKK